MHDVVVIGSGVGGLAAAIELAARGSRVLVLEGAEGPGGKAGIVSIDGVEVDTGPSVLTMPHVFDDLLRLAGMRLESEAPLRRPSPFMRYLWPDGTRVDVHHDRAATLASVGASLGREAAEELAGFLGYTEEIWSIAAPRFVLGDAPTVGDLLRLGLSGLREASRLDAFSTMWGAIRERVRSPHLRDILARYATYNGSDPRRAPATLNCIAHVELGEGAVGITGGTFELVRALYRAAGTLGVEFRFGARVERILVEGGRAAGVSLADGTTVRAPSIVANADVAHIAEKLLSRPIATGLPAQSEPSTSGYCAIVRARRRAEPRPPHLVLFPPSYMEEFAALFDRGEVPRVPTIYLCAQESAHGRRGWLEHEPIFLMINAPAVNDRRPARESWPAVESEVLARLRQAGLLDADDDVVWRRTPADLAERFPGSRGALYGAASHSWNAAFKRPANAVERVPGLYLASGSAHPGGGLPLAALSGKAAARAALASSENVRRFRRNA
ncbi:MAG: phytoene desaturase [Myxococcales bacterium]|nr:phytoene desaturase [Myxococcales bacterium]